MMDKSSGGSSFLMRVNGNVSQRNKRGIPGDKKKRPKFFTKKYKTLILRNDGNEGKRNMDKK